MSLHARVPRKRKRRKAKAVPFLHPAKSLWKRLESVQNSALSWIFSRSGPPVVLRSLAGLPSIRQRFQILALKFLECCRRLDPSNPVSVLLSWSAQSTFLCRLKDPVPYHPSPEKSILVSYILPSARGRSGFDEILRQTDKNLRESAISWRCGRFGLLDTCHACSRSFTRSHIHDCSIINLQTLPPSLIDSWNIQKGAITGLHYTIIDHILNLRLYSLFNDVFTDVRNFISRPIGRDS